MAFRDWKWPTNLSFPSVIQKVKTDGVLTPLLWLCGLSFVATMVTASLNHPVVWVFAAISCMSVVWVFRGFDFFRESNPMLIQSEKLQIEMAKNQLAIANRVAEDADVVQSMPKDNARITSSTLRSS